MNKLNKIFFSLTKLHGMYANLSDDGYTVTVQAQNSASCVRFHCTNEQPPRLPSTLGYAPLSFVAEDANFLRATGCYGGIYPLLQKRFSSAKVLTPVLGSYLRIRNTTLRFGTTPISLKVQPDGDRARRFPLWSRRPTK